MNKWVKIGFALLGVVMGTLLTIYDFNNIGRFDPTSNGYSLIGKRWGPLGGPLLVIFSLACIFIFSFDEQDSNSLL